MFWGWSLLLWTFWLPCHFYSAQKLWLYSQCDYTGFYCASLFEFMSEPTKVHTYATMRSDSSETNAFFSWTSWIHCSIISGEPLLPGSGKIQCLSICVWWSWKKKKKRKTGLYGNSRYSVVEQDAECDTASVWVSVPKEKLGALRLTCISPILLAITREFSWVYMLSIVLFTFYYQRREGK